MLFLRNYVHLSFLTLLLILASCAYTPTPILNPNITSINIPIFSNKTLIHGLEDKLSNNVIEKFILDGHLNVVSAKKADVSLQGEIISYNKEPLSYDSEGYVTKYKLWILVNVSLIDKEKKQLWKDKFEEFVNYIPPTSSLYSTSSVEYETEEDAIEALFEDLSWDIVNRTIEGW
ncbi:MAG: LptE family protein [bacterium]|nr:LptE family protein [bacterium]